MKTAKYLLCLIIIVATIGTVVTQQVQKGLQALNINNALNEILSPKISIDRVLNYEEGNDDELGDAEDPDEVEDPPSDDDAGPGNDDDLGDAEDSDDVEGPPGDDAAGPGGGVTDDHC